MKSIKVLNICLLVFLLVILLFVSFVRIERHYIVKKFENVSVGNSIDNIKREWGDYHSVFYENGKIRFVYKKGILKDNTYGFIFDKDSLLINKTQYW